MNNKQTVSIGFEQLIRYLASIGFEQRPPRDNSVALHHAPTGTMLLLIVPQTGDEVRPADFLSVLTRLEYQGIVDEAALNELRGGRVPLAS